MLEVVAVKKNEDGNLTHFQLSDGRVVNHAECAAMCDCGELALIHAEGREGADVIRSYPNSGTNLVDLPEIV